MHFLSLLITVFFGSVLLEMLLQICLSLDKHCTHLSHYHIIFPNMISFQALEMTVFCII